MTRRNRSFTDWLSSFSLALPAALFLLLPLPARADAPRVVTLSILHHKFIPDTITVSARKSFTIHVTNNDNHPEEFESYDLEFEIIILPHRSIDVPIRPLPPGTYEFFGDFHPRTARGRIHVAP
jgi:hypothetical protein